MGDQHNHPTMIIPQGTEIGVSEYGQLSIRTPGNLVIQNGGTYSVIQCTNGSLRIDPNVGVEAVSVRVAETCYIAGALTAWQVRAKKIVLERGAQAFIMLRESEVLELDRQARLVGNFASEKELYLLMGRFNEQVRGLTQGIGPMERQRELGTGHGSTLGAPPPVGPPVDAPEPGAAEALARLQTALQDELQGGGLAPAARADLRRLLDLVRAGNVAALAASFPAVLSRLPTASPPLQEAWRGVDAHLGARP